MSNPIVSAWMTHFLDTQGYTNAEVMWSLNYCQGDGACFQGGWWTDTDLTHVAKRVLNKNDFRVMERLLRRHEGIGLKIKHSGHYYHYNSFDMEEEWGRRTDAEYTPRQQHVLATFFRDVKEDIVRMGRQMEQGGYKILEAGSPAWWHFNTDSRIPKRAKEATNHQGEVYLTWSHTFGRFTITVRIVPDDDFDAFEDVETYKDIVDGKVLYCGVIVKVTDEESGGEWGENSLWGISDSYDLPYVLGEVIPECTAEAISEARKKLDNMGIPHRLSPKTAVTV